MKSISKIIQVLTFMLLVLSMSMPNARPVKATAPDQIITIDISAPTSAFYGQSFTVAAHSDSLLGITYSASGACTNLGATFTMISGMGNCTVQYDQAGDIDYNPAVQVTEIVTAQPAAITVTADVNSKNVGDSDPALTYTITNGALIGVDDFTGALTRDSGESAGDYAITQGTLALNSNYDLTYIGANMTIMLAPTATITPTETTTATPAVTETPTVTATTMITNTPTVTATPTAPAFYVSLLGDDNNTCDSVGAPCLTIMGALGKALAGDTIKVAIGTYTSIGSEVVLINKATTLLGGWDANFDVQSGASIIDGEKIRRGITNHGNQVVIDHFVVQNGFAASQGGGIFNDSTLTINNSTISDNIVGAWGQGGALYNSGTLVLNYTTVLRNVASSGGALYNLNGTATFNHDTVAHNSGVAFGNSHGMLALNYSDVSENSGGIRDFYGVITLNSSSVSNNSGNGIFGYGDTINVMNSTLANNIAPSVTGMSVGIDGEGSNLIFNNSTIAGNELGILVGYGTSATLQNSILVNNTVNCDGFLSSASYNLIGTIPSDCYFTPSTGDLTTLAAKLGPLTGSPAYLPLSPGSPAINAGNPATCLTKDQRDVTRPQGGRCDIGAYEWVGRTISGNSGVAGALLSYSDGVSLSVNANDNGDYSLQVTDGWGGTVTASKPGYTFSPASRIYSSAPGPITTNLSDENYTATRYAYAIYGNAGVAGATLSYDDGGLHTITADSAGNYAVVVPLNWSGTITPSKTGYTFLPINKVYANIVMDRFAENYVANPITYTITGNVGVAYATLNYIDGISKTAKSNSTGLYSFKVSYNWSGIVTPSKAKYKFLPIRKSYSNVMENKLAQNYTAYLVISRPIAPTGIVDDVTPTFKWSKIVGATAYRISVYTYSGWGRTQVVSPSVCNITTCSFPITISGPGLGNIYRWYVQTKINGTWQTSSDPKFFNMVVKPGFWSGAGMEFYVTASRDYVKNFAIYISVSGCGSYKITKTKPISITGIGGSQFNANDNNMQVLGTFMNPRNAKGTLQFSYLYIPGCGYVSGGPFNWVAAWKSAATQPASFMSLQRMSIPGKALNLDSGSYIVEPVAP